MVDASDIEIYKQKYDTFRHFDRLRWQLLQLAVYSTAGIIAFGETVGDFSLPSLVPRIAVGTILIFVAAVMLRLRKGIIANGIALQAAGKRIGDTSIPSAARWWQNLFSWIAVFFGILGLLSLLSLFLR